MTGVVSAVNRASRSLVIIYIPSDLGKRGAISGTPTPNPLIRRHSRAVFGCVTPSLTCCDVFAPVCQRVPWAGDVGVNRVGGRILPLDARRLPASAGDCRGLLSVGVRHGLLQMCCGSAALAPVARRSASLSVLPVGEFIKTSAAAMSIVERDADRAGSERSRRSRLGELLAQVAEPGWGSEAGGRRSGSCRSPSGGRLPSGPARPAG